ncbi:hypothetical protein SLEP1_g58163 [Rubroshorea leprosula]|uniref:Uncharacterized protein n=1 Tax=Rubroshorea leprosula TaxID=152421 RepID=A0AAV5MNF0_9ROSI|nr:hypothetical protein SLEP1_g58163 [Rubroshorea leprosula]
MWSSRDAVVYLSLCTSCRIIKVAVVSFMSPISHCSDFHLMSRFSCTCLFTAGFRVPPVQRRSPNGHFAAKVMGFIASKLQRLGSYVIVKSYCSIGYILFHGYISKTSMATT